MAIRIVRLGTPRNPGEGIRLGTVRRPPRGVRKSRYSKDDWYDVWFPNLAPSAVLIGAFRKSADAAGWKRFSAAYRSEMATPENSRLLDVLAAFSHQFNFSVGCYCENESRCHRGLLRSILRKHGADITES